MPRRTWQRSLRHTAQCEFGPTILSEIWARERRVNTSVASSITVVTCNIAAAGEPILPFQLSANTHSSVPRSPGLLRLRPDLRPGSPHHRARGAVQQPGAAILRRPLRRVLQLHPHRAGCHGVAWAE